MAQDSIFKQEPITRIVTTWEFDENILIPIEDNSKYFEFPHEVWEAFYENGYKISACRRTLWKRVDGFLEENGTFIEATIWRHSTMEDSETITLVHGQKVIVEGYGKIVQLEQ
jgi:hypothetical protein